MTLAAHRSQSGPAKGPERIVLVNATGNVLSFLESVLGPGQYDVMVIETSDHAYSQIKLAQPHLVVVCAGFDDVPACQVLSMLKLDGETRRIPVVTCMVGGVREATADRPASGSEDDLLRVKVQLPRN
jgi:DNA-binding response OmpR family regulator